MKALSITAITGFITAFLVIGQFGRTKLLAIFCIYTRNSVEFTIFITVIGSSSVYQEYLIIGLKISADS
jgi:hypothetical protein